MEYFAINDVWLAGNGNRYKVTGTIILINILTLFFRFNLNINLFDNLSCLIIF